MKPSKKQSPLAKYNLGKKHITRQRNEAINQSLGTLGLHYSLDNLLKTDDSLLKINPYHGLIAFGPWVLDAMLENETPTAEHLEGLGTIIQSIFMPNPVYESPIPPMSVDWTRLASYLNWAITNHIQSKKIPDRTKPYVALLNGDLQYIKGVSYWKNTEDMCNEYESLIKAGNSEGAFKLAKSIVELGNSPISQLNCVIKMYELAQNQESIEIATKFRDDMKKRYQSALQTVSKGPGSIWLA